MSQTHPSLSRRSFARLAGTATATLAATGLAARAQEAPATPTEPAPAKAKPFNLNYAPHFGTFEATAGKDLIDQIKFMADQGFTALEDNGMMGRSPETQEKIAREMERLGMTMGVFVAYADTKNPTFANPDKDTRQMLADKMKQAVETARRVRARWATVVPGAFVSKLEWDYQTANAIDMLRFLSDICEPSGLIMVLEPLNPWTNHPGCFLTRIPQAYQICRAVGSPSCKILDDLYHQQITEGNLIPNMIRAWDEIAYIQVGDNPGRCEPTTGEINYHHIFRWLHQRGYQGVIGMEHGNSQPGREGESRVLEAYRKVDAF